VYENGRHGVYFRDENEKMPDTVTHSPQHNRKQRRAGLHGVRFYIDGETHDIVIEDNTIRSTSKGNQTGGVS